MHTFMHTFMHDLRPLFMSGKVPMRWESHHAAKPFEFIEFIGFIGFIEFIECIKPTQPITRASLFLACAGADAGVARVHSHLERHRPRPNVAKRRSQVLQPHGPARTVHQVW